MARGRIAAVAILVLATALAAVLLFVPFSSSNESCGSVTFPRRLPHSLQTNERWCSDHAYRLRATTASGVVAGALAVLGISIASQRDRRMRHQGR